MKAINRERVRNYSIIFLVVYVIVGGCMIVSAPGYLDRDGDPKGGDFITFYAASVLARNGSPTDCYASSKIFDTEAAVSGTDEYATTWDYPPTFLLAVLPLSRLPYLWSLALWLAITMAAYVLVVRCVAPHPLTTGAILAFPGTFQNLIQGQNGFLSAALLGGGFLMLASRPFLAGCMLGLLSYKPQIAGLVVVGLLAGKQWKAIAGTMVSSLMLAAISLAVFGAETWEAFFRNIPVHSEMLASGYFPIRKMPTAFGAARILGAEIPTALALQGILAVAATATVVWIWHQRAPLLLHASGLTVATCLCFPYLFDYDLAILAPALAYLAWHAQKEGWMKWEKLALLGGWSAPFAATVMADCANLQVGPVLLSALLVMIVLRVKKDSMKIEAEHSSVREYSVAQEPVA